MTRFVQALILISVHSRCDSHLSKSPQNSKPSSGTFSFQKKRAGIGCVGNVACSRFENCSFVFMAQNSP